MSRALNPPGLERPRLSHADLPDVVVRQFGRFYFGIASVVALVSAFVFAMPAAGLGDTPRHAMVAALLAYAAACAWAFSQTPNERFRMESALLVAALAAMVLVGAGSVLHQEGLRSVALGFGGLMVCLIGAVASLRYSLTLAAVCLLEVLALAWAEHAGLHSFERAHGPLQPALWHAVLLGAAWQAARSSRACSTTTCSPPPSASGASARCWRSPPTGTGSWTRASASPASPRAEPAAPGQSRPAHIGRTPWEIPAWASRRAARRAPRRPGGAPPVQELRSRIATTAGRLRYVALSGEPHFDAKACSGLLGRGPRCHRRGARAQAVAASEMRYRELFARSPSPLLLHRRGMVVDANQAAANCSATAIPGHKGAT